MTNGAHAGQPIRLPAYAKLNLYLHVTGRRNDGYHLIDSLIAFADLADEVTVTPAADLSLEVLGPFARDAGPVSDNLALRAARTLASAAGIPEAVRIRVVKNIPAAAGLGGGSADAAATLRALMRCWGVAGHGIDLGSIAVALGADVPACLAGRAAFVGGIGERLDPAPPLPEAGLVLVNPGVPLATRQVFSARSGPHATKARFATPPADVPALAALLADRANDLTDAAIALAPVVGDVLAALRTLPGCRLARMTGSGATCFGLFDDQAAARAAAERLTGRSGWWVHCGRLVTRPDP